MKKLKVSVIGSGSFGTALASLSARSGHKVMIYSKNDTTIKEINEQQQNLRYFPDTIKLPKNILATNSIDECLENANMVIHAIPVQKSMDFLKENAMKIPDNTPYIISSKGILLQEQKFFSEVWSDVFKPERNINHCVFSGPSFAIEIINQVPTAVTIACKDLQVAKYIQRNLHTTSFKSYVTDDVRGVEIGGALKNPLAIAVGMVEGMGYGINSSSALITRGLKEMSLFSERFGGKSETLFGLSGVGDVMLTCLGGLSRNKKFGLKMSEGMTADEILEDSMEVAEGVPTLMVLDEIITKHNLNMPIFKLLAKIVKGHITPDDAIKAIMLRDLSEEEGLRI
jgi:glycerol-3-phosphate dehydrogenase (NAD+)